MKYPRILIFGQPFNNFSGGGITLTNLFKGWQKDKIAVTFLGHGLLNVTTDVCDTYYQLGEEEHKWIFPFNVIQRKFTSGIKIFDPGKVDPVNSIQKGIRYRLVNRYFYPVLRRIGVFHFASSISVSTKLKKWLDEFCPEVLYLQVSTREEILFAEELIDLLKIPCVIHMMDDWPSTISNTGLFRNYWKKRIDREFKQLLNHVNVYMSISDAMSAEYLRRYKKSFIPFHNPIDTETWLAYTKTDFRLNREDIKILYSGRIGIGITESLLEVAMAIESINKDGFNVKLHIQTPSKEPVFLTQLRKFKSVIISPFAKLEQLPEIFSKADILVLANDFSKESIDYLRLSMPTKVSEYMISGTPVLVYSPGETAVSEFFISNGCGICVTNQDHDELSGAIQTLISDEQFRKKISIKAVAYAKEKFDSLKVRGEFQSLVTSLTNTENYVR